VALRVIAERLPQSLDSPKSSIADVDALPSDDLAHATPIASDLDSPC
jgi:hypothetical protein